MLQGACPKSAHQRGFAPRSIVTIAGAPGRKNGPRPTRPGQSVVWLPQQQDGPLQPLRDLHGDTGTAEHAASILDAASVRFDHVAHDGKADTVS